MPRWEVAFMITFDCLGCGKGLRMKDEFAGRKAKCPKCGGMVLVPMLSPAFRETTSEFQPGSKPAAVPPPLPWQGSPNSSQAIDTALAFSFAKRFLSLPWLILI